MRDVLHHLAWASRIEGGIIKELEVSLAASIARHRHNNGTIQVTQA